MTSKKNMTSNRSPRRIDRTAGGRKKKAKPLTVKQIMKNLDPDQQQWMKRWSDNYVSKRSKKN